MKKGATTIDGYELLDFGRGRKLEKYDGLVLDRPTPAADGKSKRFPDTWAQADVVLDPKGDIAKQSTRATEKIAGAEPWIVRWGIFELQLRLTPFGHVGVFPEQAHNWSLLDKLCEQYKSGGNAPRALNLFAYTGGSTMAMAAAGARVVHVDASGPAVAWARRNCDASRLSEHPIRWIQEDARKFVARERKRNNKYELVVLDPPSFGHGPKGRRWDINVDLQPLLDDTALILSADVCHIILSGHSPSPSEREILRQLCEAIERTGRKVVPQAIGLQRLSLDSSNGAALDAGYTIDVQVAPV